jgi:hypothetical protein
MTQMAHTQDTAVYLARAMLNEKHGCIDLKGNEVIPLQYDDMGFWGNGLIPVNKGAKMVDYLRQGGIWGYCNYKGQLVIPLRFEKAETFHEGLATVQINKKWGFINPEGKIVIAPQYSEVKVFSEGLCAVNMNGKWGYIDKKGQVVIQPVYGKANRFNQGVAWALVGELPGEESLDLTGGYCLINHEGKQLTQPVFQSAWDFVEGLVKVEIKDTANEHDTKIGFVNIKGEIVIPAVYDYADDFHEGMAVVGTKNVSDDQFLSDNRYTYGYINNKGHEVIKPQYSMAQGFFNGHAVVSKGRQRRMGIIETDTRDNSIINYKDWPTYALIDKTGNYILDFDWRALAPIENDLFLAERARTPISIISGTTCFAQMPMMVLKNW